MPIVTDERSPSRPAAETILPTPSAALEVARAHPRQRPPLRGFAKWGVHLLWIMPLVMVGLFLLNGLVLARGTKPHYALTMAPALVEETPFHSRTIKVLTWDLGQCGARPPGLEFASKSEIRDRLIAISEVINREQPDLVVLLDVLTEFTLCDINQPRSIAEATGMHCWAYGENFQVGWPFLRVTGGNAILSRRPLQGLENSDRPGAQPFWNVDPTHGWERSGFQQNRPRSAWPRSANWSRPPGANPHCWRATFRPNRTNRRSPHFAMPPGGVNRARNQAHFPPAHQSPGWIRCWPPGNGSWCAKRCSIPNWPGIVPSSANFASRNLPQPPDFGSREARWL
jgi:hypothetical protein